MGSLGGRRLADVGRGSVQAVALVLPFHWPEHCGRVMIEAMACLRRREMRVLGPARDGSTTWQPGHRFRARPLSGGTDGSGWQGRGMLPHSRMAEAGAGVFRRRLQDPQPLRVRLLA